MSEADKRLARQERDKRRKRMEEAVERDEQAEIFAIVKE